LPPDARALMGDARLVRALADGQRLSHAGQP